MTIEEKAQGNLIRKKFAVLSSIQPGTKTQNYEKRDDKEVNGMCRCFYMCFKRISHGSRS